jgi:hypothetical protein
MMKRGSIYFLRVQILMMDNPGNSTKEMKNTGTTGVRNKRNKEYIARIDQPLLALSGSAPCCLRSEFGYGNTYLEI